MDRSSEKKQSKTKPSSHKPWVTKEQMAALEAQYNELVLLKQELDRLFQRKRVGSSVRILQKLRVEAKPFKGSSLPLKTNLFPEIPVRPKIVKPKLETRVRSLLMQPLPQLKLNLSRAVQDFNNNIYRPSGYSRGKY